MREKKYRRSLVWLRRDLRLYDHTALARAAEQSDALVLAFVLDKNILSRLNQNDRRMSFIHASLLEIDQELRKRGSQLLVCKGEPIKEIPRLAKELSVDAVFINRDYETYAKERDQTVARLLGNTPLHSFKDQVLFEGLEVRTQSGGAFKVFTPYKNACLKNFHSYQEEKIFWPSLVDKKHIAPLCIDWQALTDLGFNPQKLWVNPGQRAGQKILRNFEEKIGEYKKARDFPALQGTSGLSVHLRFGTVSIRDCARTALSGRSIGHQTWLSELIWRDFYQMILDQFPHVETSAFKREYDAIVWPGSQRHFHAWCEGKTGYPIIDAAMRHFQQTGWMHNRLRMIVASFLVKDLLCDWRWGERYFAENLLDFDLASNNGGWQWCASTGCDAQPYFRIFNPTEQSKRFDPKGEFIRAHVPELNHLSAKDIHAPPSLIHYPPPIVDHKEQRMKALALFKK